MDDAAADPKSTQTLSHVQFQLLEKEIRERVWVLVFNFIAKQQNAYIFIQQKSMLDAAEFALELLLHIVSVPSRCPYGLILV